MLDFIKWQSPGECMPQKDLYCSGIVGIQYNAKSVLPFQLCTAGVKYISLILIP